MKKRRKLYAMHQRIQAFHSFSAAQMAQRGIVSQNQCLGVWKFLGRLLQDCQQIASAIIAYVQLKLVLRDHGIENPLDLHVIDPAIHQHPLHVWRDRR